MQGNVLGQSGGKKIQLINPSDVNFYDYDGRITNSYTKNEFLALTSLPNNPTHDGLTAQGWNWTLSDAKSYVTNYDKLDIGQMYVTDDGKTRIYISLENGRLEPYLGFAVNGSVTIDWGDGNTQTVTGNSTSDVIFTQHTYSSAGDYTIKLSSESTIYLLGDQYKGSYILTRNLEIGYQNRAYLSDITKIELSSNISIGDSAFCNCTHTRSITIPNSVTSIGNSAFRCCYSLQSLIISNNITSIGTHAFYGLYEVQSIMLPNSVTSIDDFAFDNNSSLKKIIIPDTITSINSSTLSNLYSIKSITIPNSVTSIGSGAFSGCYSLQSLVIPNSITSIDTYAFRSCTSMKCFDFSNYNSIPTLNASNAFNNLSDDCTIKVPSNLLNSWKSATNWSTYANRIVSE